MSEPVECPFVEAEDILFYDSWDVGDRVLQVPEVRPAFVAECSLFLDIFDEGLAGIRIDPGTNDLSWERDGNVLVLSCADAEDFENVEYYHLTRIVDWSLIGVSCESLSNPQCAFL